MKSYSYQKTITKSFIALLVLLFLVFILASSCKSGEGDGSSGFTSTTIKELSGVYKYTGFKIVYDSGKTLKDEDVHFDGEMTIYESGHIEQDITIREKNIHSEGKIEIIDDSTLKMYSRDIEYELDYDYNGKKLVTYLEDVSAIPYDEVDHWTKISDEP